MRVLVCGGRDYSDKYLMFMTLSLLPITAIIQGGASGADAISKEYARYKQVPADEYKADWSAHGKAAGPIRNLQMLEEGKPDLVVAFPGGKGTANMIKQAKSKGVPVIEIPNRDIWEQYGYPEEMEKFRRER